MDKLKKRIFITLFLLLIAGTTGLFLLLTNVLRQNKSPAEPPAQTIPATEQNKLPAKPTPANTADVPLPTNPAPVTPEEEELTRLELEDLKLFLPDGLSRTIQQLNRNVFSRGAAYVTGIQYFQQQRAKGEISAQEQDTKQQAYKEMLDRMWQRRTEMQNRTQRPHLDSKPHEPGVQTTVAQWTEGPCANAVLPPDSPQNLTCRWGDKGFCAFFDNGRPFFCRTNNAQKRYKLNRWGTSITVTQKTPLGQPLSERYYANDKLARATDYDAKNNLVTQVWFDGNNSFRLTQTDNNGKVLDKYYFHAGKPYVRYPGGNDMGEINGPWELKNEQIFTDGKPLYTLPGPKLAPDVCMIFNGYCSLPAMPYPKNELPDPDILLPETQKDSR